jgi:hypothetical protein
MKTKFEARAAQRQSGEMAMARGGALVDGVDFAVRRSKQDGIAGD